MGRRGMIRGMICLDELFLISIRGLGPERTLQLRKFLCTPSFDFPAQGGSTLASMTGLERHRWLIKALGMPARGPKLNLKWPRAEAISRQAAELDDLGVRLIWRGEEGYPARLERGLGAEAPAWIFILGDEARLSFPQVAIVGSRKSDPEFNDAAMRLAKALSDRGLVVTSGMARGADSAAHDGAADGCAGTIGLPARGLVRVVRQSEPGLLAMATLVGLGLPEENFNAGLAIRRNHAVAALASAVVLVQSGVRGGSFYAVKWALRAGRPVWTFDAGPGTPDGNANLLDAKLARPLAMDAGAGEWADTIAARIQEAAASAASAARAEQDSVEQLDLLG